MYFGSITCQVILFFTNAFPFVLSFSDFSLSYNNSLTAIEKCLSFFTVNIDKKAHDSISLIQMINEAKSSIQDILKYIYSVYPDIEFSISNKMNDLLSKEELLGTCTK